MIQVKNHINITFKVHQLVFTKHFNIVTFKLHMSNLNFKSNQSHKGYRKSKQSDTQQEAMNSSKLELLLVARLKQVLTYKQTRKPATGSKNNIAS